MPSVLLFIIGLVLATRYPAPHKYTSCLRSVTLLYVPSHPEMQLYKRLGASEPGPKPSTSPFGVAALYYPAVTPLPILVLFFDIQSVHCVLRHTFPSPAPAYI